MANVITPSSKIVLNASGSSGSSSRHPRSQRLNWTGKIRRYTPYKKTPRSRKFTAIVPSKKERTKQGIALKRFVNKTWYVYQVTPLYKFKQDAASLKQYSRYLSSFLQSEVHKGLGIGTHESVSTKASFQIIPGLDSPQGVTEGIEITVFTRPNQAEKERHISLTAVMCSVGVNDITELDGLSKDFVKFPVLFTKGLIVPMRNTIKWMETQFDCRIRKMKLNPLHLSWMVAMWTGASDGSSLKPTELRYAVPPAVKGLTHITLSIQQTDAAKLWKSVHDEDQDEVISEEVAAFIEALESHFYCHFKIHLSSMTLNRIGTPLALVGNEGRLKFLMATGVRDVLHHLTDIALEKTSLTG